MDSAPVKKIQKNLLIYIHFFDFNFQKKRWIVIILLHKSYILKNRMGSTENLKYEWFDKALW